MRVTVRVTPRAKGESVEVLPDGTWRVRVRAVAEAGRANEAVCRVVAEYAGVSVSRVAIVRGASGRLKRVEIQTE